MEVRAEKNAAFLMLKKVYNLPGRAAKVMEIVRDLGVYIDGLWAIAKPDQKLAELMMLGMGVDWVDDTLKKIRTIDGQYKDISGAPVEIIKDLTSIIISGINPLKAPDILHRCFDICKENNINIEIIHTTLKELVFYVKSASPVDKLVKILKAEFEIK